MATRFRPLLRATLVAAALVLAAGPAFASLERARAAQARGDLRTAQIELRNAVRTNPNDAALRMALAQASLDLGDADTAEKESRAALERGADRAAATALLIRAQLGLNRAREVLREFPAPAAGTDPTLAGTILAGRFVALSLLERHDEAREAAQAAVAVAPQLVDAQLALSAVRARAGDRAGAEAAVDAALAADPASVPALLRKSALLMERGEPAAAAEAAQRVVAVQPGNVQARLQRSEALLRQNDDAGARAEVEAALRLQPGSVAGNYLRALLQIRASEWRQADETLQRLGAVLPNLPDGLLLLATVKRQLNQTAQALDAAQRHLARQPTDLRGARLLASLELDNRRPAEAAAILERLVGRTQLDAEALDLLGRAQVQAGRPREGAESFRQAIELAPGNAALLARLAAARLAVGDMAGMAEAAQQAVQTERSGPGARLMLAMAAMARGELEQAGTELGQLDAEARRGEPARVLEGMIQLIRYDTAGARATFEGVLRDLPESVPARVGLARVARTEGRGEDAERLLGEVLRRDPGNAEAIRQLANAVLARGPRAEQSLAVFEAAQQANPTSAPLAFALASVLGGIGQHDRAAALLQSDALRGTPGQGAMVQLRLSEVRAAQERWAEAEAAARAAVAEAPRFSAARRQLALLLARRGDGRNAELVLEEGLRAQADDLVLLGATVAVAQSVGGIDAALAAADRLTRRPGAMPAAASLRGDLLMQAQRPAEAAQAYAAAHREAPSSALALREATALLAARQPDRAAEGLQAWIARNPNDAAALNLLGQVQIGQGRAADAERSFRRVVELAPADSLALNNLAWLLQERGAAERPEARRLAERAFFLAPTAEIADTLGWILAQDGEAARALPLLRAATVGAAAGRSPSAPGIAFRLAYTLNGLGQRAEAIELLEQVLQQVPEFPERAQAEALMGTMRRGG